MNSAETLKWFTVPGYNERVYLLGCFAERVTLYSQQVRALNLVWALLDKKVIEAGKEVVIVGGGAAGLTAAAGAAKFGVKVLLLEQLGSLMEPLASNRQRWIHPFISDWPFAGSTDENAKLPLLDWNADYAEKVASQIENRWNFLVSIYRSNALPGVDVKLGVQASIDKSGDDVVVSWKGSREEGKRDNVPVILAIGFGFEVQNPHQYSYWTEDDIDGGFRKPVSGKWLVSGVGDGALTDLMRLCINRFRHEEISDMFDSTNGDVRDIQKQLREFVKRPDLTAEQLTAKFRDLSIDSLVAELEPRRRRGIEVVLNGPRERLYGAKASILNRLIVRVLEKMNPPAFGLLEGDAYPETIRSDGKRLWIKVDAVEHDFDRIIIRHGPKPRAIESLDAVRVASQSLKSDWEKENAMDQTKLPQWPKLYFGPEGPETLAVTGEPVVQFQKAVGRFPVRAQSLTVSKVVRKDGVIRLRYEFGQLLVVEGALKGLRCYLEFMAGTVSQPELDEDARELGIRWEEDPAPGAKPKGFETELNASRDRARKRFGTLLFPAPRRRSDGPITFGVSFTVLNAEASSAWEFDQLYPANKRKHVDGKDLNEPMEYIARVVWFPVETLKMRVTLPNSISSPVWPSVFKGGDAMDIERSEVVKDGVLQMYPPQDSALDVISPRWSRQAADALVQSGQFTSRGLRSELTVSWPAVGSCYTLDWKLPTTSGLPDELEREKESAEFRSKLLAYRERRVKGDPGRKIRDLFMSVYQKVEAKYRNESDPKEQFVLSLLTYDEKERRLKLVDTISGGGRINPELWEFWLPFGGGLSGVCFKQQDSFPLIYLAPRNEDEAKRRTGPELYLPLPNMEHTVLMAVPLEHPDFKSNPSGLESSRQRLGVIDIGSDSKQSKLLKLTEQDFQELNGWFNEFRNLLVDTLRRE
jgi:hypothetical protein